MKFAMNAEDLPRELRATSRATRRAVGADHGRRRARSTTGRSRPTSPSRRSSTDFTHGAEGGATGITRRARARHLRRLDHHRPHLARPARSRRPRPAGKWLQANGVLEGRLQQLRLAPRQPRGDDARHVRQRAHQEPDDPGRRPTARASKAASRIHQPSGETDVDLRRRDEVHRRKACRPWCSRGEEYGTGSSRDWAAKGTQLLGVKAVIARSFERIHRSQPGRHGRAAAAVQGRRQRAVAGHHRRRDVRHRTASTATSSRSRT